MAKLHFTDTEFRDLYARSGGSCAAIAAAFRISIGHVYLTRRRLRLQPAAREPAASSMGPRADAESGCITCDQPFLSEGKFNRMCTRCGRGDSGVAA